MARPNIVFVLIDDMGWMDLGCQGSHFYETPNLDALAQRGMRFTDGYASCPVCSPTRASILTGRYPATLQLTNFIYGQARGKLLSAPYFDHLPLEETTIASVLRDSGYSTWHVGKWHLGGEEYWPEKHGFEKNIGGCHWGMPKNGYFSPYGCPTLSEGPEGEYLTDRLTDEAIELIRNRGDKPFFLNFCHYAVHTPIQAPEELVEKYRRKAASLGLDRKDPFEMGEHFPTEHKKDKRICRRMFQSDPVYAAMVQKVDESVGRLVWALEAEGILDETLLIFTSDNGGLATAEGSPTCNAPLAEGKGWMYEGGTREPMLFCWPGRIPEDSLCSVPITSVDFFPTFCELAQVPLPEGRRIEGVSIVDLLRGGKQLDRDGIFWHYPHYANQGGRPGCSVRSGDWKLIEFFEDRHVELYNLAQDVSEETDLAAQEPEIVRRLQSMLHAWLEEVDARIPQPNPEWPE